MIRRVAIKGYKSFRDFELKLSPLTVIFGPNSSGKSNFLDALYLISQMATRKNLKEAFEGHRGYPYESLNYYTRPNNAEGESNGRAEMSFEVDVELSPDVIARVDEIVRGKRGGIAQGGASKKLIVEKYLRYVITISVQMEKGYLRVENEQLGAIKSDGVPKSRKPFLERVSDKIHLRMEGQSHPPYFDVGLDHTIVSTALYEPHYPHIAAFREELARWATYYLVPNTLMREEVPIAEIESLGAQGGGLAAFLYTLSNKHPEDFRDFNLVLQSLLPSAPSIKALQSKTEGLVALYLHENGNTFSARQISEGTLRLIGLLAAISPSSPSSTIAFEEPENGLHPARLKMISDVLKNATLDYRKQIIITTHSPVLVPYFDNDSLFICQRENDQTTIRSFRSQGALFRKSEIDRGLEESIIRGEFGG